jgi:hypothetical protein
VGVVAGILIVLGFGYCGWEFRFVAFGMTDGVFC